LVRITVRSLVFDVSKCTLPAQSELWARVSANDFLDCYRVEAQSTPRRASIVMTDFPGWSDFLFKIRRMVVTPFGLSNDGPDAADKIGPFPVEFENEQELIAGFDDKHLEFRVTILSIDDKIHLATWVKPHNIGGRLYLLMILPFHILLVRDALARIKAHSKKDNSADD